MSLKISVIANFLGTAWASLLSMLLVPVYIHLLGVEAFGLIGFFTSLRSMLAVLNLGLSPATNREIARRSRFPDLAWESLNLVRTLEVVFYSMGTVAALALALSSHWIAHSWIDTVSIPAGTAQLAIVIFGLTMMVRWPIELYVGVFRGLEKQPYLNVLTSIASLVNAVGAVIILVFVSRTLTAFLIWQVVGSVLELLLMAIVAWRLLGKTTTHRAAFDKRILKSIWRFSANMTIVSFFAIILKQMDKLLISRYLPLGQLGYYSAASVASGGLVTLISPIAKSAFPRFSSLVAAGDFDSLAKVYHKATQTVAFLVTPPAMALIFFSRDILMLWTHSQAVVDNTHAALTLLSVASLLNCFMGPAQSLNLASGQTSIPVFTNISGVILLAPLSYYLIHRMGILGAGFSWVLFNLGYFLIVPHFIHRHVLRGHLARWYLKDILPLVVLGLALFSAASAASSRWPHPWGQVAALFLAGSAYLALGIPMCAPAQSMALSLWSKVRATVV